MDTSIGYANHSQPLISKMALSQTQASSRAEARNRKLNSAFDGLIKILVTPRNSKLLSSTIAGYLEKSNLSKTACGELRARLAEKKTLRQIPLKWAAPYKDFRKIYSTNAHPDPLELSASFFETSYLCFSTALFLNDLTNRVPTNFYIASERPQKRATGPEDELTQFEIRDQFIKPPRMSNRIAAYNRVRYTLIEREFSGNIGIEQRKKLIENREILYSVTNVERTLIDCAMSPHYSGGVLSVIEAYTNAADRMDLRVLAEYYRRIEPIYPYWQRIGMIIQEALGKESSKEWMRAFGPPKYTFYIDRGYSSDWVVDSSWKVAHPRGLFHEN